ncbi:hypothetical protein [Mucilaginibacter ginsenosidivorax]|uniref:Glycosyltransferase RgtA/B/C/D-like domain-containing protein n=1 Tax=Mucilaginibacter ginsenosidivorax TaxID=862126 RepID=A0A5B8W4K9_9SPHI|nr:hypothetical protein [Mucilaginibacter ginsenosidivorax]QEC77905.1 hypothetical protein FSB76_18900 [Mucilaginibacter ginsenosidivorax]
MTVQQSHTHKIILIALCLLTVIVGMMVFIAPSAIFPDPSWGFQVMHKMQAGGAFNITNKPDAADISKNHSEFLSWWSPGQYLVPYFFKSLFGVNDGRAAAITTMVCSLLGITGLYAFFKKADFAKHLAAISVLIIVVQQAFVVPYIFYNGGEVLLFGFLGWFLYGCISFDKIDWKLALFLLLSGWIGFFCKSSFLWMYGAGCLYLWLSLSQKKTAIIDWVKNGAWIGIPAVLSFSVIYWGYMAKGANPAGTSFGFKFSWEALSFPLASPLLTGFSLDDMLNGLITHSNAAILNHGWSLLVLSIAALLSVLLAVQIVRIVPNKSYALLFSVFYLLSILFFGYSFLKQANISYEGRHLRIIGLLITPGVVYLVSLSKLPVKIGFGLICLFITALSIRYFAPSYYQNATKNARGTSGIAQLFIDQPSLDQIMELDRKNNNAIFVFISPDLGLEINHNRYVILDPIGPDVKIEFDDYVHYGHAGPIFIMLPASYMGPKSNIIRKCFPGYKGFHMDMLSDKYVLYSAK